MGACVTKYAINKTNRFLVSHLLACIGLCDIGRICAWRAALRKEYSDTYFSQVDVHECLEKKAADSQKVLQQAEARMLKTFAKWDEWESVIARAKANLAAANQSFVKYRYDQCEFAASLGRGAIGAALDMRRLACVAELNNRRATQLRDAAADLNRRIERLREAEAGLPLE